MTMAVHHCAGHQIIVTSLSCSTNEASDASGTTSLHDAACKGNLPVVQYLCEQGLTKRPGMMMAVHHCTGHQIMVTSL